MKKITILSMLLLGCFTWTLNAQPALPTSVSGFIKVGATVATVTTTAASSIQTTSAVLGGNITDNGGHSVTERGVVYSSTDQTPTVGESEVTQDANGSGNGSFSETISDLTNGVTYYFRAYAINAVGTSYGSVLYFTTGDASLAVELTDFTVSSQSGAAVLSWRTESETENLGFIIERKVVGAIHESPSEWSAIASYTTTNALAGHGSSSEANEYTYTDAAVVPGTTYSYRLGDVDYRGTTAWHSAVEITVTESASAVPTVFGLQKAYPNPFNPSVKLTYSLTTDASTSLKIYNMLGQEVVTLVNAYQNAGNYSYTWQPEDLSAGIYMVRLESGKKTNMQKVVFVK